MWYTGIDWADDHHDAVVIDEAGHQLASVHVTHTPEGLNQLTSFLQEITGPDAKEQMACIVETTHGLLIAALLEAGFAVYPVNPRTVDRRRKPSGAQTDATLAYLVAKTGRSDLADLRRLQPDAAQIQELKALTHDQDALIQSQTRLVNQLTACLKASYPVALQLFTKVQQHSTLVFLQTYPTPEAAKAASLDELTAVLKQAHHPNPTKVAQHIWQALQQPHRPADAITTRTKARFMVALASQLLPLVGQITADDKEITRLFLSHPDSETFSRLPGAAKRLAPRLLAGWGDDRTRSHDAASVQARAGTSPVPYESGNYSKVHKRYGCIKSLRNTLHQFAWESTRQEEWALD